MSDIRIKEEQQALSFMSPTMPVYDPDAERVEDFERSGVNEIVNCCVYSRKSGEFIERIDLDEVSRTLANKGQFIWLGLYDPSIETIEAVQKAFDIHELALEDAFNENRSPKLRVHMAMTSLFCWVRSVLAGLARSQYPLWHSLSMFMGNNYIITIRTGASNSYAPVRAYCHRRPEKMTMGPVFVLHADN